MEQTSREEDCKLPRKIWVPYFYSSQATLSGCDSLMGFDCQADSLHQNRTHVEGLLDRLRSLRIEVQSRYDRGIATPTLI